MERLGQYLRSERGKRGMSLEEVSVRTRIRLQTLEALERDDYPTLPAEVTVKGFLRAYARCLDLDEREVLARYQAFAAEYFQAAQNPDPMGSAVRSARSHAWQQRLTVVGLSAAALIVVISSVVALSPRSEPNQHPTDISSPMELPPPHIVAPEPLPGTGEPVVGETPVESGPGAPPSGLPNAEPEPAAAPPREAAKTHQLAVTASEPSWVQVTIDNTETKEALLQPGDRVGWAAAETFKLTVGNAGGVAVEFNGQPLPSLGPTGRVRTVVLPRVAFNVSSASGPAPPASTSAPSEPAHAGAPGRVPPALTSPTDSTRVPPQPLQLQ